MTIEEFIEKCQKRPIPQNPMARVRLLARELAEGASYEIWAASTIIFGLHPDVPVDKASEHTQRKITSVAHLIKSENRFGSYLRGDQKNRDHTKPYYDSERIALYAAMRWEGDVPRFSLLVNNGYVTFKNNYLIITKNAFDLLEEADIATIFISYKRSESSAFALLIRDRLQQYGLEPFVDMQLQAGDDWRNALKRNIQQSDYMIVLLGQKTLASEVTVQEIQWALESNVILIPIWHNKFAYQSGTWGNIPVEVDTALTNTHTIRVIEENPLTYDTALRELLNRFGLSI